jgi:hypothetical protein
MAILRNSANIWPYRPADGAFQTFLEARKGVDVAEMLIVGM